MKLSEEEQIFYSYSRGVTQKFLDKMTEYFKKNKTQKTETTPEKRAEAIDILIAMLPK